MGTNFYQNGTHIGKRSAAGAYCWDCGVTLCKDGEEGVHDSDSSWHKKCPICGKSFKIENIQDSAAGKELGFNKNPLKRNGVSSCCSFRWSIKPDKLKETEIEDEYGEVSTFEQFQEILKDCPIRYYDSIGSEFS